VNVRVKTDRRSTKVPWLVVLAVAVVGGGVGAVLAETGAPAPHAAPAIHIRTTANSTPSPATTTTSVTAPPAEPPTPREVVSAPLRQPVTTTPTTVRPPLTVAPVTTTTPVAPVATTATTAVPQPPNVPAFVDATCSGNVLTVQGQMTSAQAGVTVQLLIASDAFLVTTQTDAAGDFDWTGAGPACAPDTNLFVGLFGALTTTTTSCEVDCFESTVTDEPQ
jgi:hypothetical protein